MIIKDKLNKIRYVFRVENFKGVVTSVVHCHDYNIDYETMCIRLYDVYGEVISLIYYDDCRVYIKRIE